MEKTQVLTKQEVALKPSNILRQSNLTDDEKYEYICNSYVSPQLKEKTDKVFHELELVKYALTDKRCKDRTIHQNHLLRKQKAILIGELNTLYHSARAINLARIDEAMGIRKPLKYQPLSFTDPITEEVKEIFCEYSGEAVSW